MDANYATPEDFNRWAERARGMSLAELNYAIKDCLEASRAAGNLGKPVAEGRYCDEAYTYMDERVRRLGHARFY